MTTFADQVFQLGGMPVGNGLPGIPFTGNYWWVDPVNGADGNPGNSPARPLATLYRAIELAESGNNDVVFLQGSTTSSSATAGSARLSTALAQTIDSTVTAGTLNWNKNAVHLVGLAAPTQISQRCRIAPPSGTYTQATFGSGNFINVSGQGCLFANIDVFNGFSTGGVNQIAWTDSGGRNFYYNMNLQGMGDAASAADTGSHSLVLSGSTGENTFVNCTIGLDTQSRSAGVSEIAFSGGSPRNVFVDCNITTFAGAAGCFWVSVPASGIDRYVLFKRCTFTNPILSTATTMTVGMSLDSSPGGGVLIQDCLSFGATKLTTSSKAFTNQPASAAGGALVTAIS